ncbi:unnamed protein product [Rhizophagus irregularis]|uniref:Uncharacterized protein n=1 Tax=Rhizophagus irregularis TaxID=588596 RepID=A0A915ZWY1_9GLOM|nr:unnamed protein product [Rhizophagus irregularis]
MLKLSCLLRNITVIFIFIEAGERTQDLKLSILQAIQYIIQDFPLDDHEVSDELANALKTFNFSDMMELKEFLNIPEENMVYEILDDDEIITEIVDNFKKKPNEKNINDDLDEINNNIEEEVINFSVALKNLKKVNIFLL